MVRHEGVAFRNAIISVNALRPASFAVSASLNSRTTERPLSMAYSFRSLRCAGMENPSRSWSFEDTRAYDTASVCGFVAARFSAFISLDCLPVLIPFQENLEEPNRIFKRGPVPCDRIAISVSRLGLLLVSSACHARPAALNQQRSGPAARSSYRRCSAFARVFLLAFR